MAKEVETRTGRCEAHGTVDAARQIPEMGFPFIYFALVLQPDFVTCGERALDAERPPLDDHGL
jgi:hypothetical protein